MSNQKSLAAALGVQRKNRVKGKAPHSVANISLEEDSRPSSIAEAILSKRKAMAAPAEEALPAEEPEMPESAEADISGQEEPLPFPTSRAEAIRRKLKDTRGF